MIKFIWIHAHKLKIVSSLQNLLNLQVQYLLADGET